MITLISLTNFIKPQYPQGASSYLSESICQVHLPSRPTIWQTLRTNQFTFVATSAAFFYAFWFKLLQATLSILEQVNRYRKVFSPSFSLAIGSSCHESKNNWLYFCILQQVHCQRYLHSRLINWLAILFSFWNKSAQLEPVKMLAYYSQVLSSYIFGLFRQTVLFNISHHHQATLLLCIFFDSI